MHDKKNALKCVKMKSSLINIKRVQQSVFISFALSFFELNSAVTSSITFSLLE